MITIVVLYKNLVGPFSMPIVTWHPKCTEALVTCSEAFGSEKEINFMIICVALCSPKDNLWSRIWRSLENKDILHLFFLKLKGLNLIAERNELGPRGLPPH